uniref:Alpha-1,3-mannosyl-glycoprotein 4-beta-N-acetylglucosaminyltransferase A n=1 Tax=Parascaris univalens TaxID=6257 RepID=A0A915ASC8_PARUN
MLSLSSIRPRIKKVLRMRISPFRRLPPQNCLFILLLLIAFLCLLHSPSLLSGRTGVVMNTITTARTAESIGDYMDLRIASTRAQSLLNELQGSLQNDKVAMPLFENLLPYLRNNSKALQPSLIYPNSRVPSKRHLVIGVPTVPREKESYLLPTLQSLAFGLSFEQQRNAMIVIMIGSQDGANSSVVREQISLIEADFKEYLNSGLFQIMVPPREWYPPDLNATEPNLGDSPQRMYWRTKQNLDYLFLMLYCRELGDYYLQVEDDILAKPGYMAKIETFIREKAQKKWFVVEFASLGFIGKLFHAYDLPYLIYYIALLYRYKPVDWILDTVFIDRYCPLFEKPKNCSRMTKDYRLRGATLFQHIGIHSSLSGKVQKLKEKNFGESNTFNAHVDNPAATVTTNLKQYDEYGIQQLYDGHSLFWSWGAPKKGDYISIQFSEPTLVKGLLVRSGNAEHPGDKVDNNTVILCQNAESGTQFKEVTEFNERGVARLEFSSPELLASVRIEMRADYSNWLLISELHIIQ